MGDALTYDLHPLSSLFPRMVGAEFDALRSDIKANGLRSPIVLHDGMILDGGNRYRACIEAGVEPRFAEFEGGSLVSFVLSANLHRRHMSMGQQAAIVASAQDWASAQTHGGARRGDQAAILPLETVKARAAESGASERTQRMADKVAKADPALAVQVAHGEVSLPKAHAQVSPPNPAVVAKAAKQAEADANAAEAFDTDPDKLLEALQAENETLLSHLRAAEADDKAAEVLKWRRVADAAQRSQSDAMDNAKRAADREAWAMKQLRRCGKAVGIDDTDQIAPAVEAFVRQSRAAVVAA